VILLITGYYDVPQKSGPPRKAFMTSHGIDLDTDRVVITSNDPPQHLGARFDPEMQEWVID
jgi:hypothetical protein